MQDIKEYLSYDPKTGLFTWLKKSSGKTILGSTAGRINRLSGRIQIKYKKKIYSAHRLAWYFYYGDWPSLIDHKNQNPSDNKISNLRILSNSENCQNSSPPRKNNNCGYRGVSKARKGWKAQICTAYKVVHLGTFNTPEEAHQAYLKAKKIHHPSWVE